MPSTARRRCACVRPAVGSPGESSNAVGIGGYQADDSDPLIGQHGGPGKSGIDPPTFTIPAPPLRHRCTGIKRFTSVRGSGYFFMPSISDVAKLGQGHVGGDDSIELPLHPAEVA